MLTPWSLDVFCMYGRIDDIVNRESYHKDTNYHKEKLKDNKEMPQNNHDEMQKHK